MNLNTLVTKPFNDFCPEALGIVTIYKIVLKGLVLNVLNALVWSGPELQLFLGFLRQVPHVLNTKEIFYSCSDDRGSSRKTCPCIVDEVCWPQLSMLKIAFQSDSLQLQLPTNFVKIYVGLLSFNVDC